KRYDAFARNAPRHNTKMETTFNASGAQSHHRAVGQLLRDILCLQPIGICILNRDSPDDSRTGVNILLFRPCSKTDARCGWLPAARAARTMVEGRIWLFSLASGRILPVCA